MKLFPLILSNATGRQINIAHVSKNAPELLREVDVLVHHEPAVRRAADAYGIFHILHRPRVGLEAAEEELVERLVLCDVGQ